MSDVMQRRERMNPFQANGGQPLRGRTAIITGAGQNIGRGIALMLAAAGANIVVNGRRNAKSIEGVAEEVRELDVGALPILADAGDPKAVERMVAQTIERFGGVDIAISNAAIRPHQAFKDITIEAWQHVINNNLSAVFYMARAVLPTMQERGWGRLIHISGQDGWSGMSNRAHNVTCKAGVFALCKALGLEYGPYGITANTVSPGTIDTIRIEADYPDYKNLFEQRKQTIPVRRLGTPEDVAAACLYLCSDGASYVTGQAIHVNGGEYMY